MYFLVTEVMISFVCGLGLACAYVQLEIYQNEPPKQISKRSIGNESQEVETELQNSVSYYHTNLKIGNPPQSVTVQLDTGSSDLWIISSKNILCKEKNCRDSMFDAELSSTFKVNETSPSFAIAYGDSTFASGIYAQDDIEILGKRHQPLLVHSNDTYDADSSNEPLSFTIKNGNFALAEKANSSEAVWGIGMITRESMAHNMDEKGGLYPTYSNIPVQMKEQGYIDTVAYSLWLNDLYASSGSLLFGAVDHAKYLGQLHKVPLVNAFRDLKEPIDFSVMLHGITAYNRQNENAEIVRCSIPVLLDSGTTYSQLPMQMLKPILDTLGAEFEERDQVYLVSETRKNELGGGGLQFNLSGAKIDVSVDEILLPVGPLKPKIKCAKEIPREHNKYEEDIEGMQFCARRKRENYYVVGIFPADVSSGDVYILGDTFLRSAYVVYDLENKEVAIANTYYNTTDSQIDRIDSNGIPSAKKAEMYSATTISEKLTTHAAGYLYDTACAQLQGFTKSCGAKYTGGQDTTASAMFPGKPTSISGLLSRTALSSSTGRPGTSMKCSAIGSSLCGHTKNSGNSLLPWSNKIISALTITSILIIIFI